MQDRILVGEQGAQALDDVLEQAHMHSSDGMIHSYQGILVRQVLPDAHPHRALIPLQPDAQQEVTDVLKRYGERTRIFFGLLEHSGRPALKLGADMLYNTYAEYLECLRALAPRLEDALFFLGYDGEDDDGETYYVIDRCQIRGGELLAERRVSGPSEDFDASVQALYG